MKTAIEIIAEIQELPLNERQKVSNYLMNEEETESSITDFTPEILEVIDRNIQEAQQGINVSPTFKTAGEAIAYLRQFRSDQ